MREQAEVERGDGLDLPSPCVDGIVVHTSDEPGWMELQVLANGGPSDARPKEQGRRLDATSCDDDDRRAHGHRHETHRPRRPDRLDADRATVARRGCAPRGTRP